MGKHILNSVKGFVKRAGEIFLVDPMSIKVVDGWNDRTDFSGQEELVESIKEVGVRQPLLVRKSAEEVIELVNGERRLRAVRAAIDAGFQIAAVPVIVAKKDISEIDLYFDAIISNGGKPLEPVEEANSFKRLVAWGVPLKEIASKSGKSYTHVRNRLELANGIPAVKEAVTKKEISVKSAQEIVSGSGGKVAKQAAGLVKVKSTPKTRKKRPKLITIQDLRLAFVAGARYGNAGNTSALSIRLQTNAEDEARKRYP